MRRSAPSGSTTSVNAEVLRAKMGLPWTYLRVGQIRLRHGIPTACPIIPRGAGPRGDGLVPVDAVMGWFRWTR